MIGQSAPYGLLSHDGASVKNKWLLGVWRLWRHTRMDWTVFCNPLQWLPDCHQEGESVVYVDDDTDSVHSRNPDNLVEKLQREVNNTVSWLNGIRLCLAGHKSFPLKWMDKRLNFLLDVNHQTPWMCTWLCSTWKNWAIVVCQLQNGLLIWQYMIQTWCDVISTQKYLAQISNLSN